MPAYGLEIGWNSNRLVLSAIDCGLQLSSMGLNPSERSHTRLARQFYSKKLWVGVTYLTSDTLSVPEKAVDLDRREPVQICANGR